MKQNIKAVCFDLDDTLCAYWDASRKALWQALDEAELGVDPQRAFDAWKSVFQTFSKEVKTDRWYERYLVSGEPTRTEHLRRTLRLLDREDERLAKSIAARYAELRNEYLELFPEAKQTLQQLKGRYCMCLITNGPADIQRQEVETLGIKGFFDHILIEGEMKLGKPDAAIFEAARTGCGYEAHEMLFVGNAFEQDVQGAKNAGWHALWLNRVDTQNPGTYPQPDAEITHLFEVCDWLGIERPPGPEPPLPPKHAADNWRR
ncbi:MAG: HAD family hydrolase [Armatimonadetes bacterium]|nr:HAD family hydrolase [Armatimonadota bacterium]